jgi:hypothetical protein
MFYFRSVGCLQFHVLHAEMGGLADRACFSGFNIHVFEFHGINDGLFIAGTPDENADRYSFYIRKIDTSEGGHALLRRHLLQQGFPMCGQRFAFVFGRAGRSSCIRRSFFMGYKDEPQKQEKKKISLLRGTKQ